MLIPQRNNQGIHVRNAFTLFVCISILIYLHFQIHSSKNITQSINDIVKSIFKNQTYQIGQSQFNEMNKHLSQKQYSEMSQGECLVRIYFEIIKNQQFQFKGKEGDNQQNTKIQCSQLQCPTISHDLQNLNNCGDIISVMNYLNPSKVQFIYTNFLKQKYGSFQTFEKKSNQKVQTSNKENEVEFCIMVNQFNSSSTKLRKNLNSITSQTFENYRVIVLDNGSGDGSYEIAKITLQDLQQKEAASKEGSKQMLNEKYRVIKQEKRLPEWDLFRKHKNLCDQSNYLIFVDGRDQFISTEVLNIVSRNIKSATNYPHLITASILRRKELTRAYPYSTTNENIQNPYYTFKVISKSIYDSLYEQIGQKTSLYTHPFQVNSKLIEILYNQASQQGRLLQIDQMLYVYDSLQSDRNQYLLQSIKKQMKVLQKNKKVEK